MEATSRAQHLPVETHELKALGRRLAALQEKNRVLACMYRIAQLAVGERQGLQTTLAAIRDLIPHGFDAPERIVAAIELDQASHRTPGFEDAKNHYGSEIRVGDKLRGRVVVGRLCKGPESEDPNCAYTAEEKKLIESAARKVAYIVERKETDEEKQELEARLRHADRLATIGQLAAGIAHELNNPLGDILGFAQLSCKHPHLPEQIYQDQVKIVKSTLYAREVIKKILLFSRQSQPHKGTVNLNRLIEEWMDFFEFRCKQNQIEIVLTMDQNLPAITGDPSQLNQVLINLAVNAIHAMPHGGRLTITTGVEQGAVYLKVQDTGTGIDDEIRDKIFLPFFTTKEVDRGTGLGLSVVYGIVQEHNGRISLTSTLGQGSTFTIQFPTATPDT
jgi:signal transduction histidine kinase